MAVSTSPRAALTGVTLSLGLASFAVDLLPVQVSKASQAKAAGVTLTSVCPTCDEPHKVAQEYWCTAPAKHGPFGIADCDKAMVNGDTLTKVDKDKIAEAKAADVEVTVKHADLSVFPAAQVEAHTAPVGPGFRLRPRKGATEPYALFLEVFGNERFAFLCELTIKNNTKLYRVATDHEGIGLVELGRPNEVYERQSYAGKVDDRLLAAAENLVEALVDDFDPQAFVDRSIEKLAALKAEVAPAPVAEVKPAKTTADDLLNLLMASVKEAA